MIRQSKLYIMFYGLTIAVMSLTLGTLVWPTTVAQAQEEAAPAEAESGARSEAEISAMSLGLYVELMSPYCPGASLRDCGSGQAEVLRERIRGWVREGQSKSEIEERLVIEFGEAILSAPRFKGIGLIAYLAPVAAILLGLGAIMIYLKRQERERKAKAILDSDLSDDFEPTDAQRSRIAEEVRARIG